MLLFTIIQIFKETKLMRVLVNTMHIVIAALFVLHTFTLGARWFISGYHGVMRMKRLFMARDYVLV
jgi:hypothetical protein